MSDSDERRVERAHHEYLMGSDPWYRRAHYLLRDTPPPGFLGAWTEQLLAQIEHELQRRFLVDLETTRQELAEQQLLEEDPHKYYGVSRSDFL